MHRETFRTISFVGFSEWRCKRARFSPTFAQLIILFSDRVKSTSNGRVSTSHVPSQIVSVNIRASVNFQRKMASSAPFIEKIQSLQQEADLVIATLAEEINVASTEKNTAIMEVARLQNFVLKKDKRIAELHQEIEDTHAFYNKKIGEVHRAERAEYVKRVLAMGRGLCIKNVPEDPPGLAGKVEVPRYTPKVSCFLAHGWDDKPHLLRDCSMFLSMSNQQRANLLFKERRCYGCFLSQSLTGHTANECDHPRFCNICKSDDHHQLLCGSREMYRSLLLTAGVARK